MTGASKILTVSYGTFSCTLEGFDDPFNTMKAIAEYFRDLAAEDRYFGAEPPQPDAAMLHRIAEREIQRRVEAKIQDNGVILRAGDTEAPSSPRIGGSIAAATEAAPQPVVEMPARMAPPARHAPVLAPVLDPALAGTASLASAEGTESVAEKLSRLRKAAAESQKEAETASIVTAVAPISQPQTDTVASDDYSEDDDTPAPQAVAGSAAEAAEFTAGSDSFDDLLPEDMATTTEEILSGDLPPEVQGAGGMAPDAADFDDEIAAEDLAGLMALDAARSEDLVLGALVLPDGATPADATEDHGPGVSDPLFDAEMPAEAEAVADATPDMNPDTDDSDDALLASLAAETSAETGAETAPLAVAREASEGSTADPSDDALRASLGALIDPEEDVDAPEPVTLAPAAQDASRNAFDAEDDDDELEVEADDSAVTLAETGLADLQTAEPAQETPADPAPVAQTAPAAEAAALEEGMTPVRPVRPVRTLRPTAVDRPPEPAAEPVTAPATDSGSPAPVTVEKLQRARARVIKIRRNEAAAAEPAAVSASLSQEAEAALAAELAALEQDAPAPAAKPDPTRERRLGAPTEDVAVTRLMAEASTQMEVPDTKRRQSAIAHLKAAVAATIAERRATGSTLAGNGSERLGAYRDDLAKVVRPAAPAPGERPAPLVLVSEQRIDRPADPARTAPALTSVQPNRPMTSVAPAVVREPDLDDVFDPEDAADNIFGADSGFPEFAERLGATDLPDLLEAAAAYIACVEGRDSFTRPQLMRHIDAAAEGLTREDGLRSFGILLRDGVIERSRRGQFAISEASPLLAEARKIAG